MATLDVSDLARNKKKGLPSITQPAAAENNDTEVRPVKRRPKKKIIHSGTASPTPTTVSEEGEKRPTPRRRRPRSLSQTKDAELSGTQEPPSVAAVPKKKKKKPKPDEDNDVKSQVPDPIDRSQSRQESQGSKTSLITASESPRKKKGKKRKKAKQAVGDVDEFGDSPWAEDLRTMKDDIITGDGRADAGDEKGEAEKPIVSFISAPILQSQPLDKIFVETSSKFKGQRKSTLMKQRTEEIKPVEPQAVARKTTIDFAVSTHNIFRVVTLFLHGLTAGLALWQLVTVFTLSSFTSDDFLEHYYRLSLPLQCSYYLLLVICTVSTCDRFDIGNPTPRFVLKALTLQNGAVSIVLYLVALVLNVVAIRFEDRIYLFKETADLYSDSNVKSSDINTFKGINAARSVLIILAWLVLSITPKADRLRKNLLSGDTGLTGAHEMEGVSAA